MAEAGAFSIQDNVGAALRFTRENWRYVLTVAVIGAVALTLLSALSLFVPAFGLFASLGSMYGRAAIYTALLGAVLVGAAGMRGRLWADAWRVFAAMAIIGFFLFIVTFVLMIPGAFILAAGPLTPYVADLQAAAQDEAAIMQVMTRFLTENPITVGVLALFYLTVWLLLTSRLYLAAPASVDQRRILTFETWSWTKGAMLRITAARLLLLLPAYVLATALDFAAATVAGVSLFDPAAINALAQSNPAVLIGYIFATTLITTAVYSSLEAALSANLYRDLRPGVAETFE